MIVFKYTVQVLMTSWLQVVFLEDVVKNNSLKLCVKMV